MAVPVIPFNQGVEHLIIRLDLATGNLQYFELLTAVNFLLIGPLLVGIPVLASSRLPEGAVACGRQANTEHVN